MTYAEKLSSLSNVSNVTASEHLHNITFEVRKIPTNENYSLSTSLKGISTNTNLKSINTSASLTIIKGK
jgi:hypothetical protein